VLAQFHATFFWEQDPDYIHWMTDGMHYKVDYVSFCQILGFGAEHRKYTKIHDNKEAISAKARELRHVWKDPHGDDVGKSRGLKGVYYVMNNIIRNTINPKDGGASDVNGFVRDLLSHFPNGTKFNVARFMWVELAITLDDGRRHLPYAPYLMYMIERLTGKSYPKDCIHTSYTPTKTSAGGSSKEAVVEEESDEQGEEEEGSQSVAPAESPIHPSRSSYRHKKKSSRWKKLGSYLKSIMSHCTYASQCAYKSSLDSRAAVQAVRE
jgi:hypothetical protein